jgi:tRNA-dihydrouridine synthase
MEGVTTFPTRLWLHLAARPEAATTPFLRATKTYPERHLPETFAPELFSLRGVLPYSVVPQFMACDTDNFLRAADLLPPDVEAVELNCGCPSPNGAGRLAGSGILRDPQEFGATVERLSTRLGARRLAVKMRIGVDSADEFDMLLPHVARLPLARLTVHGRTRLDKYRGRSRWELIQRAAVATPTPTWASGDVHDVASATRLIRSAPAIAGAMIGRGILHNPWVFQELRTGATVDITPRMLANALACYAMLHELWMTAPGKLVARLASGRIGDHCGTAPDTWERLCVQLSGLLGGAPFALFDATNVPSLPVSATSFGRVRYLWGHLRSSLPEPLSTTRLMRSKSFGELLAGVLSAGPDRTMTIKTRWSETP